MQGQGTFQVAGERHDFGPGDALFVPAGAEHRFTAYEQLALLVIFNGPHSDQS